MRKKLFLLFMVSVLALSACSDSKIEAGNITVTSSAELPATEPVEEKPWYSEISELSYLKEYEGFAQPCYLGGNDRYILLESLGKLAMIDKTDFSIVTADIEETTFYSAAIKENEIVLYSKISKKIFKYDMSLKQLGSFDVSGYYGVALAPDATVYASNDDGIYKLENVFDSEALQAKLLYTRAEYCYMEENTSDTLEELSVSSHYLYLQRDDNVFCVDLENNLNYSTHCYYPSKEVDGGDLYSVNYKLSDDLQPERNYLLPYVEKFNMVEYCFKPLMSLSAPDEYIKSLSDGVITTCGKGTIRRYNEEEGTLLSVLDLKNYDGNLICSYNAENAGVICIFVEYGGKLFAFNWDSTAKKPVDTRDGADTIFNTSNAIEKLKKSVEKKYGVNIYYGEDAVGSFSDYDTALCDSEIDILKALAILDNNVFSYFPDGFFKKMIDGTIVKSYDIYLAGDITSNNEYNLSSAGGVTNVEDDRQIMLLNIHNPEWNDLEITVAHETWHTIEAYISRLSLLNPDADYQTLPSFSYWYALNPKGFCYSFTYNDDFYNNDGQYTIYAEDAAPDNMYFIDTYAKINELEDKARLFETIFSGIREEYSVYDSEPLMQKARFMSAVVRKAFEIPDGTELIWESRIGKVEDYAYYEALEEEYYATLVAVG